MRGDRIGRSDAKQSDSMKVMSIPKRSALPLAAIAFYAGMTGGSAALSVVSHVDQTMLYKPSTIAAAGFNVEMHGRPAPGIDAEAAIAGLRAPSWVGGAPLKLLPTDAKPGKGTRLVLVFHGAGAPSEAMCGEPDILGGSEGSAGGRLRVFAVYCSADRMIARGALSADPATSADADYRSAMQSLLIAMFPPQPSNISTFGGGI